MGQKFVIYFCLSVGAAIGGYIPALWHDSIFSPWSVILSAVGGIVGLYVGIKINQAIGG
ncbi:MAG: hypothetical protein HZC01_04195 [Candidatus Kerfeldbacteria bacterium]|nr:hypothetical protein [Candidatus Kerfeldbacteria bacterium]